MNQLKLTVKTEEGGELLCKIGTSINNPNSHEYTDTELSNAINRMFTDLLTKSKHVSNNEVKPPEKRTVDIESQKNVLSRFGWKFLEQETYHPHNGDRNKITLFKSPRMKFPAEYTKDTNLSLAEAKHVARAHYESIKGNIANQIIDELSIHFFVSARIDYLKELTVKL